MIDQNKFLEVLKDIMEAAKKHDNEITKDEISTLLGDITLSQEQMDSVYQYLAENRIRVKGVVSLEQEESEEDSMYLKMYMKELGAVKALSAEEKLVLLEKYAEGSTEAKDKLLEASLHDVVSIAKKHRNKGVSIEDLIQEGNIGLLRGLSQLPEEKEKITKSYLKDAIQSAVLEALEERNHEVEQERAVVAKANLIHEAMRQLTEDMGGIPTAEELAEYTKLDLDEIRDILELSVE
ncbi:sigma factor [Anaeromicropila populeti]|uniref:RNA polymerase primary sigma factor n=1 Tax=Anaeromicropila populeti TaxID=37658 RepID=A0A1I6JW08_9FIRM|nr:sigma factor [Anaeromicropila populeti]SFR83137.1 RNA polymerase primary sigma factor [Anaeromicropila populeti]